MNAEAVNYGAFMQNRPQPQLILLSIRYKTVHKLDFSIYNLQLQYVCECSKSQGIRLLKLSLMEREC